MPTHHPDPSAEPLRQAVLRAVTRIPAYRNRLGPSPPADPADFASWFRERPTIDRGEVLAIGRELADQTLAPSRVCCTGGTTSQPLYLWRSAAEIRSSEETIAAMLRLAGVNASDRVAILLPFGLWNVGHLCMRGVELVGAISLPIGTSVTLEAGLAVIRECAATVILTHPGMFRGLTTLVRGLNCDPASLGIRRILWAGEPFSEAARKTVQDAWQASVHSVYGAEELDALAIESTPSEGLMPLRQANYFEIVSLDSATRHADPSEVGKLLVTTLIERRLPLVRYDTGDLASWIDEDIRLSRLKLHGRSSEFLVLDGATKLYAAHVEHALLLADPVVSAWQVQLHRNSATDSQRLLFLLDSDAAVPDGRLTSRRLRDQLCKTLDLGLAIRDDQLEIEVQYVGSRAFLATEKSKVPRLISCVEEA